MWPRNSFRYKAHLKKKAPFVDFGERLIDFSNIQFQQVTKEALSQELRQKPGRKTSWIMMNGDEW